ncbi:MAG: hypothetical protein RAK17_01915, partial [Caldisphaera sp.]|nr:hypothetical protein [Caldisphaera sp.]
EKIVLKYFLENVSVGDLRAIADLSKKGIENPENVIESLIEKGFLERGNDCFNLSYYLRIFVSRRGMPNFD